MKMKQKKFQKKNKSHIERKEDVDVLSFKIKQKMELLRNELIELSYNSLYQYQNKNWYRQQMASNQQIKNKINITYHKISASVEEDIRANKDILKPKQINALKKFIDVSSQNLITSVYKERIANINKIQYEMKSLKAEELYQQINKVVTTRPFNDYLNVTYKGHYNDNNEWVEGKTYKFENYMEMKVRSELQSELSHNMLEDGYLTGAIFYICSFYGDCAKDHADYQGKIYYDARWRDVCPKQVIDKVEEYINAHELLSMQEVIDGEPYLTTRPNCRHYFTYISVDEVLGINTYTDLEKALKERNMALNGTYNSSKYEALQEQRLNERNLRASKEKLQQAQLKYNNMPKDISRDDKVKITNELNSCKNRVRNIQLEQRNLIKANSNLKRDYKREQVIGNMPTLNRK